MSNKAAAVIAVEVIYALPQRQSVIRLQLHRGATVGEALRISNIAERHPEINIQHGIVGIFGKPVSHDTALKHNDRVELYRPLRVGPKRERRNCAPRR